MQSDNKNVTSLLNWVHMQQIFLSHLIQVRIQKMFLIIYSRSPIVLSWKKGVSSLDHLAFNVGMNDELARFGKK